MIGTLWYYMLRGDPMQAAAVRKSVGHSNVLAPAHQSREGAKKILLELFVKALKRLRAYNQAANALQVSIRYRKRRGANGAGLPYHSTEGLWMRSSRRHLHANDEATWLRVVRPIMDAMPDLSPTAEPSFVGIVFSGLLACQDVNLSLFEEEDQQEKMCLAAVVDDLNRKHAGAVALASMQGLGQLAPLRIPYGVPDHGA